MQQHFRESLRPTVHHLMSRVYLDAPLSIESLRECLLPGNGQRLILEARHIGRWNALRRAYGPVRFGIGLPWPAVFAELGEENLRFACAHIVAEHARVSLRHTVDLRVECPADFFRVVAAQAEPGRAWGLLA